MNKVYNTQEEIASEIEMFLKEIFKDIRKTQLNILPYIVLGIILSESVVASDIAKELKNQFSFVQLDSVIKRIKRFFSNELFKPYDFFEHVIKYIISNYKKKHGDKRAHIVFDHMFSHDNYTVFMITMRIGKQGIPLWFRCFEGKDCPEAFEENLLQEGISYVSSLFGNEYNLIFLADRPLNSTTLMDHIASLGHTFCIRLKRNIKVFIYDKKEGHKVWKFLDDIKSYEYHSNLFNNIEITDKKYVVNIAISKRKDVAEPWIIVTNGDTKRAIKDYGYRFGAIECLFKNQKSNGFRLESTVNASLKYFENLYAVTCFASIFLIILGANYSKNTKCYKNEKIVTHKVIKGIKRRIMSLFNVGLTLFKRAFNSLKYIRIPFSFKLYDI